MHFYCAASVISTLQLLPISPHRLMMWTKEFHSTDIISCNYLQPSYNRIPQKSFLQFHLAVPSVPFKWWWFQSIKFYHKQVLFIWKIISSWHWSLLTDSGGEPQLQSDHFPNKKVANSSWHQQPPTHQHLTPQFATSGPAPCSATTTPTLNNSKLPPKICPGTHCSNFCLCGGFLISALSGRRRKMVSYGLTMPTVVALTGPPCTQSIYILHGHWHRVFPSTM